jgi:nucleotide-binding universal stress UspA family protein
MFKSILCAVDGSSYTQSVLEHGLHLAQRTGAVVRLISIIDVRMFEWVSAISLDGFVPAIPGPNYLKESKSILEQKAEQTIAKAASYFAENDMQVQSEIVSGVPADAINEASRQVDIVICGQRGDYAQWSGQLLGATTEALTHIISRPLLIVGNKYYRLEHLIAAYDASDCASKALKLGMEMAELLKLDASVIAVAETESALEILEEAKVFCDPYAVKTEFVDLQGPFADALLNFQREKDAAFVVMGSHGKSKIKQVFVGSNTLELLRRSTFPVVLQK